MTSPRPSLVIAGMMLSLSLAADAVLAKTVVVDWKIGSQNVINITVGDTVRWVWGDGFQHDVVSASAGFDSGLQTGMGFSFEYTFLSPGDFDYICSIHSNMFGTVSVTEIDTEITADGVIESTSGGFKFPDGSVQTSAVYPTDSSSTAPTIVFDSTGAPALKMPDGSTRRIQTTESAPSPVSETGQRECWDSAGKPTPCTGTGQDGERSPGGEWPDPRLVDNGDGTVTDKLTGLIWLQDAGCLPVGAWREALQSIADFKAGSTACTNYTKGSFSDWRLPTVRELASLVDYGQRSVALPSGHPFIGLGTVAFWSATSVAATPDRAWTLGFDSGAVSASPKPGQLGVWPVRGSDQVRRAHPPENHR